jgi:hypothetical protein
MISNTVTPKTTKTRIVDSESVKPSNSFHAPAKGCVVGGLSFYPYVNVIGVASTKPGVVPNEQQRGTG